MSSLNCMFVLSVSTELKWRAWDFRRMMQCTCRPPQALLISSARARNTTLATQSHFYHLAKGRKWSKNTTFVSHRSFVLKSTPWPSLSLLCFRSIQKIGSILEASKLSGTLEEDFPSLTHVLPFWGSWWRHQKPTAGPVRTQFWGFPTWNPIRFTLTW